MLRIAEIANFVGINRRSLHAEAVFEQGKRQSPRLARFVAPAQGIIYILENLVHLSAKL